MERVTPQEPAWGLAQTAHGALGVFDSRPRSARR